MPARTDTQSRLVRKISCRSTDAATSDVRGNLRCRTSRRRALRSENQGSLDFVAAGAGDESAAAPVH